MCHQAPLLRLKSPLLQKTTPAPFYSQADHSSSVPAHGGPPAPAHSAAASLRAFAPENLVSWNTCCSPRPVSRVSSCRRQLRHCLTSEIIVTCMTPGPQGLCRASHCWRLRHVVCLLTVSVSICPSPSGLPSGTWLCAPQSSKFPTCRRT